MLHTLATTLRFIQFLEKGTLLGEHYSIIFCDEFYYILNLARVSIGDEPHRETSTREGQLFIREGRAILVGRIAKGIKPAILVAD